MFVAREKGACDGGIELSSPRIALITQSAPGAFTRISAWLRDSFESLSHPFDVVYLEGDPGVEEIGSTRVVRLGVSHARGSIPAVVRYMRAERPGLVVSSPEFLSPYVLIAGRMARVPVMPWEAQLYPEGFEGFPLRKRLFFRTLQRRTYGSAVRIASVSQGVADYLAGVLREDPSGERFVVVPNPIDRDAIAALASGSSGSTAGFEFVASGRLNRGKGFDILVEAARLLHTARRDGWNVSIMGRGSEGSALRAQIAEHGLTEVVKLRGFVEDPYAEMGRADCFVHPARWEGFGLVLCEAMSLRVPVLATDCPGGPREVLDDGNAGLLVAPGDPKAVADGMARMMDEPDLRARLIAAGERSLERYAPPKIAARLIDLLP